MSESIDGGTILEAVDLNRSFGALRAVSDLSFEVRRGEIFGIAGPNGAGKTTLFNLLSGHVPPTSGTIRFNGRNLAGMPPHAVCHAGIARTFQIPLVFSSGTVEENVLLGAYFGKRTGLPGLSYDRAVWQRTSDALDLTGLSGQRGASSALLSVFDKKRLMIASALATSPSLLMLDEPVGGLNHAETDQFMELIRSIGRTGVTILLIEHVMRCLMTLSDRVLIMAGGQLLAQGTPDEIRSNPDVIRVYLGRDANGANGRDPEGVSA